MDVDHLLGAVLDIPPVTRILVLSMLGLALAVRLHFVAEQVLAYIPTATIWGDLWRPFTALAYQGEFDLIMIPNAAQTYMFSSWIETAHYNDSATYAWVLGLMSGVLLAVAPLANIRFPSSALSTAVAYMWMRRNPNDHVLVFFVFRLPADYLIYVQLAFTIMVQPRLVTNEILGLLVGHSVFFLEDVYPKWSRHNPLKLPGGIRSIVRQN